MSGKRTQKLMIMNIKITTNYKLVLLAFFVLSLFYFISRINYGINFYDEGVILYGSLRVLEGNIPYKDFWFIYTPGSLYLVALSFKLFGPSIMVSRFLNSILELFILFFSYLIIKEIIFEKISIFISLLIIMLLIGYYPIYNVNNMPVLLSLLSVLILYRYFQDPNNKYLSILGILTGLAAIFRLDFGVYLFLTINIMLILYNLNNSWKSELKKNFLEQMKINFNYILGFLVIIVPLFLILVYLVPLEDLYSQFITFPTQIYYEYRQVPYPTFDINQFPINGNFQNIYDFIYKKIISVFIPLYFPIIIYLTTAVFLIYKVIRGKLDSSRDWLIITLLFLGIIFFNHARVGADITHVYSTMIIALIIFSFFSSKLLGEGKIFKKQKLKNPLSAVLKVLLLFLIVGSAITFLSEPIWNGNTIWIHSNTDRSQGIVVPEYKQDFKDSIKYIQQNVPPSEKIFVANYRNDELFINNVMFYFLSERDSATRYHDMHPGVVTTQPVQMEIIDELKKNNVQYILLWKPKFPKYPNKSSISSGVFILDQYIRNNYYPVKTFGEYTIYRKDKI